MTTFVSYLHCVLAIFSTTKCFSCFVVPEASSCRSLDLECSCTVRFFCVKHMVSTYRVSYGCLGLLVVPWCMCSALVYVFIAVTI